MLTEPHTRWMEIGRSSDPCTVVRASFTPHELDGTTCNTSSKVLPRGCRRSKTITCAVSPLNASNFSLDTSLATIFETVQNAPESGSAEQITKGRLENVQDNLGHVPSKSMMLEGHSSGVVVIDDNVHFLPSMPQDVSVMNYTSTATTRGLASRLLQEEMSYDDKDSCSLLRETRNDALDMNSPSALPLGDVEWDVERDNEILQFFSYNRLNLVLDSMFPHIAPHIVITPSEETWEEEYVLWLNRVEPQWPYYLCVPPLDNSTGHMLVAEPHPCQPQLESQTESLPDNVSQELPVSLGAVCSPSTFKYSVIEYYRYEIQFPLSPYLPQNSTTSHGCKVLKDDMVTIQKALCKANFYAASDAARVLRKRYDSHPDVLSDLEPAFTWTDPAEPILIANRRMLGAIILDSIYPFLAPHIVINSPPPQPYHLTENNSTPYTQDAAFGDRLIVEAYYINIINEAEDSGHDTYSFNTNTVDSWEDQSYYGSSTVDLLESATDSRPGSPLPETPVDDENDRYSYFAQNDDDDGIEEDSLAIRSDYQSIYGINSPIQGDLPAVKFETTSRSMFYIEEDDDELPSLDDW